ncbi:MAG TPA: hypothetical protein VKV73_16285 [Chloroflexota bacterium]|nr:hypothetical protein [Chloroflexota bacterium]
MQLFANLSPRAALAGVVLVLGSLTFACGPGAPAAPTPVPSDPFVVVRATSQAAYTSGKAHLDRGELPAALVDLDTASTNDPDTRSDIQQALAETLSQLASQTPIAEPTLAPRNLVVTTVPGSIPASIATVVAARPTGVPVLVAAATLAPTPPPVIAAALVAWRDPQGRFSLSAPVDWARSAQPQSLFGTSVVQFRDPSVQAELDVAVDNASKAVSPELYAATMEIAMQQQVPGYAAEESQPGSTGGNPSVRRVFTFTQRDAAGTDNQARGFQVAVVKGSTPYIISGSAPSEQFEAFSGMFNQVVETFRFS